MTAPSLPRAFTPFAEPRRRVSALWIALFATSWLGIWMAQLTPIQLLLPKQILVLLKQTYWVDSVVAFGIISGIAGACALIAYPLTGALSDRTTSPIARRGLSGRHRLRSQQVVLSRPPRRSRDRRGRGRPDRVMREAPRSPASVSTRRSIG